MSVLYYYQLKQGIGICKYPLAGLLSINEQSAENSDGFVFVLDQLDIEKNQCCSLVQQPSHIVGVETLAYFLKDSQPDHVSTEYPQWVLNRINEQRVYRLNTLHPQWENQIVVHDDHKKRVHVAGLGDVGSTLLTGLRLLGCDALKTIGIFDLTPQKIDRWVHEGNQIASIDYQVYPTIEAVEEDNLFNCDVFVFCVAKQVPALDTKNVDVRMAQLKANAGIISYYAKLARKNQFKGLFAVVSDPVDQLCKVAFIESNRNDKGTFDGMGLLPEQVKGFGLGVMNARAHFYASTRKDLAHFHLEGRVFGPHGHGLVVADSTTQYSPSLSHWLTDKTMRANVAIRDIGFKPYIAPALSSGSLSILAAISGNWHYSTVFIGGVYWGCLNRIHNFSQEWELNELPELLYSEIEKTYTELEAFTWSS